MKNSDSRVSSNSRSKNVFAATSPALSHPHYEFETDKNRETQKNNNPSPDDVDYWTGEALKGRSLKGCNINKLNKVAQNLRDERDNLISLGLYKDSISANEAYQKTINYTDQVQKQDVQRKYQQDLYEKLSEAKENYNRLQESAKTVIPNMMKHFEKEQCNLEKRQEKELKKFTEDWESPQKKRQYNRSSANLRNLRTQSILLLNSHRFEEMEICDKQANQLEAKESMMNQKKLESDFQEALNKMLDKHQSEKEKLLAAQKVTKDTYEGAVKHDLGIAKRRIENIEKEIEDSKDAEKVWVHYARREARGPPGKRPNARSGRKNCLTAINVHDFNTLNLPPLEDNPKWKNEPELSPELKAKRQERQEMQKQKQKSPRRQKM